MKENLGPALPIPVSLSELEGILREPLLQLFAHFLAKCLAQGIYFFHELSEN